MVREPTDELVLYAPEEGSFICWAENSCVCYTKDKNEAQFFNKVFWPFRWIVRLYYQNKAGQRLKYRRFITF